MLDSGKPHYYFSTKIFFFFHAIHFYFTQNHSAIYANARGEKITVEKSNKLKYEGVSLFFKWLQKRHLHLCYGHLTKKYEFTPCYCWALKCLKSHAANTYDLYIIYSFFVAAKKLLNLYYFSQLFRVYGWASCLHLEVFHEF